MVPDSIRSRFHPALPSKPKGHDLCSFFTPLGPFPFLLDSPQSLASCLWGMNQGWFQLNCFTCLKQIRPLGFGSIWFLVTGLETERSASSNLDGMLVWRVSCLGKHMMDEARTRGPAWRTERELMCEDGLNEKKEPEAKVFPLLLEACLFLKEKGCVFCLVLLTTFPRQEVNPALCS